MNALKISINLKKTDFSHRECRMMALSFCNFAAEFKIIQLCANLQSTRQVIKQKIVKESRW